MVRHALRLVVDAARRGTPLGRIAVLYGTRDPYARLIGDALDAADIPWFGSSIRTAAARATTSLASASSCTSATPHSPR